MGPQKNLWDLIPFVGTKLSSVAVPVVHNPVDQPAVEENPVPPPLMPIVPADMMVEDVTHEEDPEVTDLPPVCSEPVAHVGSDVPFFELGDGPKTPEEVFIGPSYAEH